MVEESEIRAGGGGVPEEYFTLQTPTFFHFSKKLDYCLSELRSCSISLVPKSRQRIPD